MHTLIWRRSILASGSFGHEETGLEVTWRPEMDVFELPGEYYLWLSLPGIGPEDVEVTLTGKTLTVSGHRTIPVPEGAIAHLIESRVGRFERKIRVPADADVQDVRTEVVHGRLLVKLRKALLRTVRVSIGPKG